MGWDGCDAWSTKGDVIVDTETSMRRSGWEVKDRAPVTSGCYWHVKTPEGAEFIYFALIERRNGTFFKKTMSEHMGPADSTCPLRLLDACPLPSDDDFGYAKGWRERVKAVHAKKQERKANPLKAGDTITFYEKTFKVLDRKQGTCFLIQEVSTGTVYKLSKKQEVACKVVI